MGEQFALIANLKWDESNLNENSPTLFYLHGKGHKLTFS